MLNYNIKFRAINKKVSRTEDMLNDNKNGLFAGIVVFIKV